MMNFELRAVSPENYDQFLAAKQDGQSTQEALTSIGEEPLADDDLAVPHQARRAELRNTTAPSSAREAEAPP